MSTKRVKWTSVSSGIAGVICAPLGGAGAQENAEATFETDTIVVTGSLAPRPAREIGSAISVVDDEALETRQIVLVSDVLRDVPGLAVNRTGPQGTLTQVRIRGAEGNQTLVFIDGIEAANPVFGEFNFANLVAADIGRIEVVRGPQSALYGSEAIGGVISVVTRAPEPGFDAAAEFEGGSFGTARAFGAIGGGSEALRGRGSVNWYSTDGVSASPLGNEDDGFENLTANFKAIAELSPNTAVEAVLRFVDAEVDTDRQDFDFPSTETQGLVVDADQTTESEDLTAGLTGRIALLDDAVNLRAYAAYTRGESDNFTAGMMTSGNRGERVDLGLVGSGALQRGRIEHTLTGAVEHEQVDFENINPGFPAANQSRDDEQTSLIGEYAAAWDERLFVSGAVRHDFNDLFEDATTFRVAGAYLFAATDTRLHASFGEGITDPSFFERFGFDPNTFQGNPDLEPERSQGWDIGVEQVLMDGRLRADLTYFQADLEDEITTVFDANFISTPVNLDGESERQGVEVAVDFEATDALTLSGRYTYLDAEGADGLIEVRRPEHVASANALYRFHDARGTVAVGLDYNGEQEDLEFIFATPETRVTLESYVLGRVAVSYAVTPQAEVFARAENVFDEDYQEVFGFQSPGAAAYAGVRLRY